MTLEITIVSILYGIELLFIVVGLISKIGLKDQFSIPISSMTDVASTLETYSRVFNSVNIKVNDHKLKGVSSVKNQDLHINRNNVYSFDLYNHINTLFNICTLSTSFRFNRFLTIFNQSIFIFQLVFIVLLFFNFEYYSGYVSIFAISIIFFIVNNFALLYVYRNVRHKVLEVYKAILDIDDVERARADNLADELVYTRLSYPLEGIVTFIKFFLPF